MTGRTVISEILPSVSHPVGLPVELQENIHQALESLRIQNILMPLWLMNRTFKQIGRISKGIQGSLEACLDLSSEALTTRER